MADPTKQELFQEQPIGEMFLDPIDVRIRATFSASGATCTVSSTRRQSVPGVTITGSAGSYAVAGLPRGRDYHLIGCEVAPPTGLQLVCDANILAGSLNASAGTLTLKTRTSSTGNEGAPADTTEIFITLRLEAGAP